MTLFLSWILPVFAAHGAACSHSIDPGSVGVEWTAFKTSAKTPVNGSFRKLNVTVPKGGASTLRGALERSSVSFDAREFESGDPIRDSTLRAAFFGTWKDKRVSAKIIRAELNPAGTAGVLFVRMSVNGVRREIPMKFRELAESMSPIPRFIAAGEIRIADFGMQGPFATLHGACEKLHTGPDGVSKTWDVVEIRLSFAATSRCGGSP